MKITPYHYIFFPNKCYKNRWDLHHLKKTVYIFSRSHESEIEQKNKQVKRSNLVYKVIIQSEHSFDKWKRKNNSKEIQEVKFIVYSQTHTYKNRAYRINITLLNLLFTVAFERFT